MALEIEGTIVKVLKKESGTGKNGDWQKIGVILETADQYPKKIKIDFWKDLCQIVETTYKIGDKVTVSVNAESREFNEKWYTDLKGWKLNKVGANTTAQPVSVNTVPVEVSNFEKPAEEDDNLPF